MIQLSDIDVLYDFSTDTVDKNGDNYWTKFWTDEGKENEHLLYFRFGKIENS